MADSISKMAVLLTSDVSGFSAGMKQSVQEAQSAAGQIGSTLKGMLPGGLGAAFSLGAGMVTGQGVIQGLQQAVTSAWRAMSELAAEAKNVTRESEHLGISVTFYEQMAQACQRAGVETEALARGMERIQTGLGEWQQSRMGPRQEGDQFRAINLDPGKLAAMAPEEQFKTIAEHLMSIQDRATRINAEMAIFGRSGDELEKTFKEIVSGSRPPILSTEEIANLAKFQQVTAGAGRELSSATKQLTADLAGAVLPFVETLAKGLDYFLGNEASAKAAAKALQDQAEAARKLGGELERAHQAQKEMAEQAKRHNDAMVARRGMQDVLQGLQGQLNGKPSWQTELQKADRQHFAAGATYEDRQKYNREFTEGHQMLDAAAAGDKIGQEVASALKGIESPTQKFTEELSKISQWIAEGRVGAAQGQALASHAREQLQSSWKSGEPQGPRLAEAGSQEAYQMMAAAMNGQQTAQQQIADLQAQAVGLNQQAVDLLGQINSGLVNRPVIGGTGW